MRDPGLYVERTALAWDRTSLSLAGVGVLAIRAGAFVAGGILLALAALAALVAVRGHVIGRMLTNRLLAVGVAAAAVASLWS